jgi:2-polyprenyl-3-methyl-5-hydroxy-6-metoxy-1,4-benzoquinol methylase
MFEVIEHPENPMAALRNVQSVMEMGGLFIGSTPAVLIPICS